MPLGPIEVIVVAFEGNEFTGGILPELERLVSSDIISIVDGIFVRRDADGTRTFMELSEIGGNDDVAGLAALIGKVEGLVSDDDVEQLTSELEPGTSAAILVFEHSWAKPLRDAVVGSGGQVISNLRIPGFVVEEILATVPDED